MSESDIARLDREQVLQFRDLDRRIKRLQLMVIGLAVVAIGLGVANYVLAMRHVPDEIVFENGGAKVQLDSFGLRITDQTSALSIGASSVSLGAKGGGPSARIDTHEIKLHDGDTHLGMSIRGDGPSITGFGPNDRRFRLHASKDAGTSLAMSGEGRAWFGTKSAVGIVLEAQLAGQPTGVTLPAK